LYKIPANTLFIGKKLIFVPECHSTNSLALEFSQHSDLVDGTVVITDHQTAGRGQRGNGWEAEAGKNLTLSIILKPSFLAIKDQFFLNIFTSLAVCDVVADLTSIPAHVKWPNDIMVQGKKLSGILIENQLRGNLVSSTVVGIGLNVNQQYFGVSTATSLSLLLGRELLLNYILEELLVKIESRFLQLRQNKLALLKEEYLQSLYWRNELRMFSSSGKKFNGSISGIDELGKLAVATETGPRLFDMKEITYVQ
jgi:BirA family biotin operon repressor/biotin-[acetyl-CoA-carboxylase] ligase